ncbi:MAG TPA: ATP-binding protein [Albitalea sp.]|uniref:PAS domain-containing sensor histidine kinase n=1 Tax=Piscinibacter sp. TaxID=1903157 RepID=UPI002ED2A429
MKNLIGHRSKETTMLNSPSERILVKALADLMPHRIYAKDAEGRFVFANMAVARGMGADSPADLLGRTDSDFYPAADAAQYAAEERDIMESHQPMVNHEEFVYYTRSSSNAWMLTTKVPVVDDDGKVMGIAGINCDITRRKQAELAMRDAKLEAERATQAKTELLAVVCHELKTPLNAVLGYSKLLQARSGLSDQEMFRLGTIERAGQHLLLLSNDLLDVSKPETANLEPSPTNVYLHELLRGVVSIIELRAAEKGLDFDCIVDPGLPLVAQVDSRRLSQILLNLLANAVKFTDSGRIWLRVRCLSVKDSAARIHFEVEDTGVGMRSDELSKIFEPFVQLGTAQRRADGVGLGLAISRKLVEVMGGAMEVKSTVGRGSTFSFELSLPIESVRGAVHSGMVHTAGHS